MNRQPCRCLLRLYGQGLVQTITNSRQMREVHIFACPLEVVTLNNLIQRFDGFSGVWKIGILCEENGCGLVVLPVRAFGCQFLSDLLKIQRSHKRESKREPACRPFNRKS